MKEMIITPSHSSICYEIMKRYLRNLSKSLPDYLGLGEQHDMAEMTSWWLDAVFRECAHLSIPTDFNASVVFSGAVSGTAKQLEKKAFNAWAQFHLKDTPAQYKWTHLTEGLTVHQIQCLTCHKCFHNFEPFQCLSLEPAESLSASFEAYFRPEKIMDWTCDVCLQKHPAERLVRFWKAPVVLILQIKRFDGLHKIETPMSFPLEFKFLEDTELCRPNDSNEHIYDLIAVGNHYGSLHGGHYTTTCRLSEDKWIHIDDDFIKPIPAEHRWNEKNISSYMLYYTLRRPPAPLRSSAN